jgi:hypothetical protein
VPLEGLHRQRGQRRVGTLRCTASGRFSGAWGFAVSDLAVARQQFVQTSQLNGLWGTPLYFLSQMLLAASLIYA